MDYLEPIFIGVLSGVLTSALLGLLWLLFKKVIIPRYVELIYRGTIIEGKWENETEGKHFGAYSITLNIRQSAYDIKGTLSIKPSDTSTGGHTNFYNFKGQIINNYLVANYWPDTRVKADLGAFLLKVDEGGSALIGRILYVDEEKMDVVSTDKAIRYVRV